MILILDVEFSKCVCVERLNSRRYREISLHIFLSKYLENELCERDALSLCCVSIIKIAHLT